MKKIYFFIIFYFLIGISVSKAQESSHPIDKYMDSCMEKDYSTAGMVKCTEEAMEMWDVELNKYYKLLIGILDENSKNELKYAETMWIKYRDSEFRNINNIYAKMEGTMYIPMYVYAKMNIVKERALKLKDYYELLTNKEPE
jgi:uncharacterized protein YecT (DUF1311 family)